MMMERKSVELIKPGKEEEYITKLPKVEKDTLNSGAQMKQSVELIKPGKEKEYIVKLPKLEKDTLNSGVNQLMKISVETVKLTES
jgi:hypothetical protein